MASLVAKEQKSANKAVATFEAIQTNWKIKRQALKEIPNSVKGEEEEKSKKRMKLLGIQKQVTLQKLFSTNFTGKDPKYGWNMVFLKHFFKLFTIQPQKISYTVENILG